MAATVEMLPVAERLMWAAIIQTRKETPRAIKRCKKRTLRAHQLIIHELSPAEQVHARRLLIALCRTCQGCCLANWTK